MPDRGAVGARVLAEDGAHGLEAEVRLVLDCAQRFTRAVQLAHRRDLRLAGEEGTTDITRGDGVVKQCDVPVPLLHELIVRNAGLDTGINPGVERPLAV